MAKKQRGARANKPNDSFGTINNDSLYKGKYRDDVYKEDEEQNLETAEVKETPVKEAETFVSTENNQPHDYKKRYDDLKRHYDTKLKEHEEEKKQLGSAMEVAKQKGVELPKTPEELEQFKIEYPDVYDVVQTIASMKAKEQSEDLEKELQTIKSKEKDLKVQNAYAELLNNHSDFNELRQDEKFIKWLEDQPVSISDGILRNNTDSRWASRVVDLYKADSKPKATSVQNSAATIVKSPKAREINSTGGDKRIWKASDIGKLKPWEFEKVENEIDEARAEGRIDFAS
tara:strand:+ start:87 stop:947 length:861 start_codon:yes stop_codon:yes gene_type:complete